MLIASCAPKRPRAIVPVPEKHRCERDDGGRPSAKTGRWRARRIRGRKSRSSTRPPHDNRQHEGDCVRGQCPPPRDRTSAPDTTPCSLRRPLASRGKAACDAAFTGEVTEQRDVRNRGKDGERRRTEQRGDRVSGQVALDAADCGAEAKRQRPHQQRPHARPRPALGQAFAAARSASPDDARQVPRDQGEAGSGGVADRGEWQRLPDARSAPCTSSTLTIPLIIRPAPPSACQARAETNRGRCPTRHRSSWQRATSAMTISVSRLEVDNAPIARDASSAPAGRQETGRQVVAEVIRATRPRVASTFLSLTLASTKIGEVTASAYAYRADFAGLRALTRRTSTAHWHPA